MEDTNIEELEGYDEMVAMFLEKTPVELRLKGLSVEQRLQGLDPEQRLQGLSSEELRTMREELRRRLKDDD